jgi:hypothetical protein
MDNETYLGDAVYASFDGYHIWLRTGDGRDQRIALEPSVYANLIRYRDSLYKPLTKAEQEWLDKQDETPSEEEPE